MRIKNFHKTKLYFGGLYLYSSSLKCFPSSSNVQSFRFGLGQVTAHRNTFCIFPFRPKYFPQLLLFQPGRDNGEAKVKAPTLLERPYTHNQRPAFAYRTTFRSICHITLCPRISSRSNWGKGGKILLNIVDELCCVEYPTTDSCAKQLVGKTIFKQ